jgi:hypothetical protein
MMTYPVAPAQAMPHSQTGLPFPGYPQGHQWQADSLCNTLTPGYAVAPGFHQNVPATMPHVQQAPLVPTGFQASTVPVNLQPQTMPAGLQTPAMQAGMQAPTGLHPCFTGAGLQSGTAVQQGPVPVAQDTLDFGNGCQEAWLSLEAQANRRISLGLVAEGHPTAAGEFADASEFISLGSYCGVARALQAIGVKRFAYPFDWVRSPIEGIIHCLETSFHDFLSYSVCRNEGQRGMLYGSSRWGGSFWHHNPEMPQTREDFTRRIERLYGFRKEDVPVSKPRVFVRAVNSTRELDAVVQLHCTLQRLLPKANVYLLVLIDLQGETGTLQLKGHDKIIFCRVNETLFADNGRHWTMQAESEAYAEAIARACSIWADSNSDVQTVSNLEALGSVCEQFDGGNPATDLFFPMRFRGQEILLHRPESKRDADRARPEHEAEQTSLPKKKSSLFARAVQKSHKVARHAFSPSEDEKHLLRSQLLTTQNNALLDKPLNQKAALDPNAASQDEHSSQDDETGENKENKAAAGTKQRRNLLGRALHRIDKRVSEALRPSPSLGASEDAQKTELQHAQEKQREAAGSACDEASRSTQESIADEGFGSAHESTTDQQEEEALSPTDSLPCTPLPGAYNVEMPTIPIPVQTELVWIVPRENSAAVNIDHLPPIDLPPLVRYNYIDQLPSNKPSVP